MTNRLIGTFLVGAALILALLVIGISRALAGEADLSWTYPTQNVDGTTIPVSGAGSIASSRVEWGSCNGTAFGTKAGEATVAAPTKTYKVLNLAPGTHCFRASVTNTYAAESAFSNAASKVIVPPVPNPPVLTVAQTVRLWNERWDIAGAVAGKVDLGVECGEQKRGTWHVIDRSQVRLNGVGERHPNATLIARCG